MHAMRLNPCRAILGSGWLARVALATSLFAVCSFGSGCAAYAQVAGESSPATCAFLCQQSGAEAGQPEEYAAQETARAAASDARTLAPDRVVGSLQAYAGDFMAVEATPDEALGSDQLAPRVSHPNYDWSMDYYRDSDQDRALTLSSETSLSIGPLAAVMHTDEVQARDPKGAAQAGDRVISLWGNITDNVVLGAGLGSAGTRDGWSTVIGSFQTSMKLASAQLQLSATHELVEESAETIRNHVQQTDLDISLSGDVTEHLGGSLEYHHRLFDDANSSNEISFSPKYDIKLGPTKLSLGYSLQYIDYAKPTELGYWAPNGLLIHQSQATWNFEWRDYYGSLQLGLGRSYCANTANWSEGFNGSGTLALGWHIAKNLLAESYLAAGRNALGLPTGWNSMNTGFRFNYGF
jgi:hypothetical protein